MIKELIRKIRVKIALWRYDRWYRENNDYYRENPVEFKRFILNMKESQKDKYNEITQIFIDWGEGWLKQEGYWEDGI